MGPGTSPPLRRHLGAPILRAPPVVFRHCQVFLADLVWVRGLGGAAPGRSGGGWARGRVQWKFHELFRGWGPVSPPPGRPNPANFRAKVTRLRLKVLLWHLKI